MTKLDKQIPGFPLFGPRENFIERFVKPNHSERSGTVNIFPFLYHTSRVLEKFRLSRSFQRDIYTQLGARMSNMAKY